MTAARGQSEQYACQQRHLVHELLHAIAAAIPLDQREFGVMQRTAFIAAKHVCYLEDIAAAGRQQSLHRVFRRGMQVQRRAMTG